MRSIEELRALHDACNCVEETVEPDLIDHDGCSLSIENLSLVISCDKCHAFRGNQPKPDILAVQGQTSADDFRWLVIEIKTTLRVSARDQVFSGINVLLSHELFQIDLGRVRVFLAFKHGEPRQVAYRKRLRDPLRFEVGSSTAEVRPRVVKCNSRILIDGTSTPLQTREGR